MNKKTFNLLIALPLVVISALTSCDNKKPVDYTVNEEEFNNAVSFKDVTHMQVTARKVTTEVIRNYHLSPNMFYELKEGRAGELTIYNEQYIRKNDNEYEGIYRDSADDSFSTMKPAIAENYYTTPQGMSLLDDLKVGFGDNPYESFKFENNLYFASQTIEGQTLTLSLKFENKKLVEYDAPNLDDLNGYELIECDCQFAYRLEDVVWPIN